MIEETAEQAWNRACKFMKDAVIKSLIVVGHDTAAEDLLTWPTPPYVAPIPKEVLNG